MVLLTSASWPDPCQSSLVPSLRALLLPPLQSLARVSIPGTYLPKSPACCPLAPFWAPSVPICPCGFAGPVVVGTAAGVTSAVPFPSEVVVKPLCTSPLWPPSVPSPCSLGTGAVAAFSAAGSAGRFPWPPPPRCMGLSQHQLPLIPRVYRARFKKLCVLVSCFSYSLLVLLQCRAILSSGL